MSPSADIRSVLKRIHEIQTRLGNLQAKLRRGPLALRTQNANIEKQQAALEKMREEHHKLVTYAKRKELEVATNDQAIAKRKMQLQEAKSNKEYQALQLQIKADEAARGVLDDEALEAIDQAETFAKRFPAVEEELKKTQELYAATKQKITEEKPGVEADIESCNAQLAAEESLLPQEFREIYDRLVRHVGGPEALAVVQNQKFCGGCNQQIPINSLALMLQGKAMACTSCARLLYLPEDFVFDKG